MAYKLVALIENHLSLGSILVTDGVHVISIETVPDTKIESEKLPIPRKVIRDQNNKSSQEIVLEYLQQHEQATWAEMGKMLEKRGFARSTINNVVTRLAKEGKIIRVSPGIYAIKLKEKISA